MVAGPELYAVSAALVTVVSAAFKFLIDRLNRVETREDTRLQALIDGTKAITDSVASTRDMTGLVSKQGELIAALGAKVERLTDEVTRLVAAQARGGP